MYCIENSKRATRNTNHELDEHKSGWTNIGGAVGIFVSERVQDSLLKERDANNIINDEHVFNNVKDSKVMVVTTPNARIALKVGIEIHMQAMLLPNIITSIYITVDIKGFVKMLIKLLVKMIV